MLISWRVPKTIQWIVKLFLIYLCIFTAFRIATVICFKPASISVLELGSAFLLGLKYDLRWIAIILLPIAVLSLFPRLSPFTSERGKKLWTAYLGITTLLVLFFYGADFGQFAYINARLNADALIFFEDPKESLQMVWQSYPVVWILFGLFGAVIMMLWMFRKTHVDVTEKNINIHKFTYRRRWHAAALLLLGWFVYGFFTLKPLDIFRSFNLSDEFKSNLALNPMQNFFTTLGYRSPDHNTKAAEYYKDMSNFLQLQQNNDPLQPYGRLVHPGSKSFESQPNVESRDTALRVDHQQQAHATLDHALVGFVDGVVRPDQHRADALEIGHHAERGILQADALGKHLRGLGKSGSRPEPGRS